MTDEPLPRSGNLADDIDRQRERIVEEAMQAARAEHLGLYIGDDGEIILIPAPERAEFVAQFVKTTQYEALLLLALLSKET